MNTPSSPSSSSIFRYAIFVGMALTLLVAVSSLWNIKNLDGQARYLATEEAKANWNKDQAFRRWATRHGGLYVKPDERTSPNPYLDHLPNRDVETTDGDKSKTDMARANAPKGEGYIVKPLDTGELENEIARVLG